MSDVLPLCLTTWTNAHDHERMTTASAIAPPEMRVVATVRALQSAKRIKTAAARSWITGK